MIQTLPLLKADLLKADSLAVSLQIPHCQKTVDLAAVQTALAELIVLEVVDSVPNPEVVVLALEKEVLVDLLLELVR